ncbi:MAG: Cna B-type domain-containing protein, partial [Clostridia bacterium]|nr:Cna B-type domain-containing protein [Clostridia bacterium]
MEKKNKVKFYNTKSFRALVAIALAVILLSDGAIQNMASLFATEGAQEAHEEAVAPAPKPEPKAESTPEPQLPAGQKAEDTDQGVEERDGPEPDPAQLAVVQGLGDTDQGIEAKDEPASESTGDAGSVAAAGNPLAEAIAAQGVAYVSVNGEVFSSAQLRERDLKGRVSGIAVATAYNEADDETPATVRVAFAVEGALETGYMAAASVALQDYDEIIEAIGEDAVREYPSAAWPLPLAGFAPAEKAAASGESGDETRDEPLMIVAFIDVGEPGEPMDTLELGEGEAIADASLPQTLSVLLSNDTILALPVEWQTEEGELVADADDETLDAGEELRVDPAWDVGFMPMSAGLEPPFIMLSGGFMGFEPMSGGAGTLVIVSNDITPDQGTYNIINHTDATLFQVRYTVPVGGTQDTILIINCLEYGAEFKVEPPTNNMIHSAAIINPTTMAVRLQNGLMSDTVVVIDCKMEVRTLTQAQAIAWMDNGNPPPTEIKVRAIQGTLNVAGKTFTEDAFLDQFVYGSYVPTNYSATPAELFTSPAQYMLRVSSVPQMTNFALTLNGNGTATNHHYFASDTPYYAFRFPSTHYKSAITGLSANTPLIEITGIKLYVPDPRLHLPALGITNSSTGYYYAATATAYYWNGTYWDINAKQEDENGYYYLLTPRTRLFNGTSHLRTDYAASLRPNWQLIDLEDGLDYHPTDYSVHIANANTQLLYQIPQDGAPPLKGVFETKPPQVWTYARDEVDKLAIIPYAHRRKASSGSDYANYGTTVSRNFVAMVNNYERVTVNGVLVDRFPAYTGPITETYEFPHQIQPTSMAITTGYSASGANGPNIDRRTALQSVTYELLDGTVVTIPEADIEAINITRRNAGTSMIGFTEATNDNRVVKVTVVWEQVATPYWASGTTGALSLTSINYWGTGNRLEEFTAFTFRVPLADEDGVPYTANQLVQVPYTNSRKDFGVAANNWDLDNYLWFDLRVPVIPDIVCPILMGYPAYTGTSTSYQALMSAPGHWADGVSSYNAGRVYLDVGAADRTVESLMDPVIDILCSSKHANIGTVPAPATEITNMTMEESIGFLNGKFTTDRRLGGWVISYSTNMRPDLSYTIPTGLTSNIAVDLGINNAGGEYLTSLRFSFDGEFPLVFSTDLILMQDAQMFAWDKHFVTGEPLVIANSFFVRLYGVASWDNCALLCGGKHTLPPDGSGPQSLVPHSTYYNNFPGCMFYLFRSVNLSVPATITVASSPYQTIYQGSATAPATFTNYSYTVNAANHWPHHRSFWSVPTSGVNVHVPWGINEYIYIELTDPEFVFNPATTRVFGVPVGPYLEYDIVQSNDGRDFLKLTFKPGYNRNSFFLDSGYVNTNTISTITFSNRAALGGNIQIGFTSTPGCRLEWHYPMGEVYFDYSELLEHYFAPALPAPYNSINSITKDTRTKWNLTGTPAYLVEDELELSTTSVTGDKMYKYSFANYRVFVMQASGRAVTLVPGKSGVYDFVNRKINFNIFERTTLDAYLGFTADDMVEVHDFTSYVKIPRNNVGVEYRDDNNALQTVVSQYDMYLTGAPTIISDSTELTHPGNVILAYTTAANPGESSNYSFVPVTEADWALVTGVKVVVTELPPNGAVSLKLNLSAPPKASFGAQDAYIGGSFTFKMKPGDPPSASERLQLGTYTYNDLLVTAGGGFVFFDLRDEDGLWSGSTANERYPTAGEVTVRLLDTDGVTVIDSTTVDPATGRFYLYTYKTDPGQIIEIDLPNSVGDWKLTKQSDQVFTANGRDSDFDRETRRMVLPTVTPTGFLNVSAGFIRLPTIVANNILNASIGANVNSAGNLFNIFMNGSRSTYPGYKFVLSLPEDDIVTITNAGIEQVVGGTTTATQAYTVTTNGKKVGETTATVTVYNRLGDAVTATYTIRVASPVINVAATKSWNDNNNSLTMRPGSVQLQLWREIEGGEPEPVGDPVIRTGSTGVSGANATWSGLGFNGMPRYDNDGNEYIYKVRELNVDPNYTTTYADAANGQGTTITNTIKTQTITATKKWVILGTGFDTQESIRVNLFRSDTGNTVFRNSTQTGTPANGDEWTYEFTGLPIYVRGTDTPIVYRVDEQTVPSGMDKTIDNETLTITNTYRADDLWNVEVVWVHTGAPQTTRDTVETAGATVTLRRNSANYKTQLLQQGDGNDWKHTFNVPYRDRMANQTFSILSTAVTGYTLTYAVTEGGVHQVIYTYTMPKVTVSGTKTWVNTPAGLAKPNVTINLYRNGGATP